MANGGGFCVVLLVLEAMGRWQVTAFGVGDWNSLN